MKAGAKERGAEVFQKGETARSAGTPINPPRTAKEFDDVTRELEMAIEFYKQARDESNLATATADFEAARDAATAARGAVEAFGPAEDPRAKSLYEAGKAREADAEQASRAGDLDVALAAYVEAESKYRAAATILKEGADVAAKTARVAMQVARDRAAAARAQELAAKEWEQAAVTEKVAEDDFAGGKFADAKKAFDAARGQYEDAASRAEERARNPAYQEALAAQKQMEEAKAALEKSGKPGDPVFLRWARDKEERGIHALKAGDFVRAKELFLESRKRYIEAASK